MVSDKFLYLHMGSCSFFCFLFFADVWKQLARSLLHLDPSLFNLFQKGLLNFLMSSRAPSTIKAYSAAWKRWTSWATSKSLTIFPVSPLYFSLYITDISQAGAKSAADMASAAVSWIHSLADIPSPTDSPLVKSTIQGIKRVNASPCKPKEPIGPDVLIKLRANHCSNSLSDLRILFIAFVSYAGFLRFDDLSGIRRKDCKIYQDRMIIHLHKAKNDQFRQGSDLTIARLNKITCPVAISEAYFSAMGDPPDSDYAVLRRFTSSKKGLVPTKYPLSYTRTREIMLGALKAVVPDVAVFGLHSFRSGGASAACSANVPLFLVSKHGRWKSESARNKYLKMSSTQNILPSSSLGL